MWRRHERIGDKINKRFETVFQEMWDEANCTLDVHAQFLFKHGYSQSEFHSCLSKIRARQSEMAGVSLRYLLSKEFAELARGRTHLTDPSFKEMKVSFWLNENAIGKDMVCPRDGRLGCALVDWIPRADRRQKTHFLSWSWRYTLEQVQSALRVFQANAVVEANSIFFHMCFFVTNHFRIISDDHSFEDPIRLTGQMVMMLDSWDQPPHMKRIWTLYEQFRACQLKIPITITMPEDAWNHLRQTMLRGEEGLSAISNALAAIRCEEVEAFDPREEQWVKTQIEQTVGFRAVDQHIDQAMRQMLGSVFQSTFSEALSADTQKERERKQTMRDLEEELWLEERHEQGVTLDKYTQLLEPLGMCSEDVKQELQQRRAHQSEQAGVSLRYVLSNEFHRLAFWRTGLENPTFNDMKEAFWLKEEQAPIGKDIVCPRDGRLGCALVDWIPRADRRPQTHFLSWTWKYTMGQLRSALEMFRMNVSPARDSSSIFLYMCFFSNNQFRIIVEQVAAGSDDLENSFQKNLTRAGKMVAVLDTWEDPVYLKRVWTVYEQFVACSLKLPVEFVMPKTSMASLHSHIGQGKSGLRKITTSICKVDSEQARAWKPEDEQRVTPGFEGESLFFSLKLEVVTVDVVEIHLIPVDPIACTLKGRVKGA